jgi:acetyl esterase/lipase
MMLSLHLLLSVAGCAARDSAPEPNASAQISTQAKLFNAALERADGRAIVVTDLDLAKEFIAEQRELEPEDYSPPAAIRKQTDGAQLVGTTQVYSFLSEPARATTLIYLAGGAYIYGPTGMHLDFANKMAEALDAEILLPAYPVTPHATAAQANADLVKMYQALVESRPEQEIILMGDSSGGGLALSMAQQIQAAGLRPADHVVMISPWLDITMANPDITPERDAGDFMLDAKALAYVGQVWAGELALDDPRVSPLHGPLLGIGELTLVSSDNELFIPDIHLLVARAEKEGAVVNYHEYVNLFHDFTVLGVPESKVAMADIVAAIQD